VNAKGSRDGKALFNIGLIDIHWHWAPLSDKTIAVTKVVLDKLNVDIEQYTDTVIIGGVKIALKKPLESNIEQADEAVENNTSWAATLDEIIFSNLNICYLKHLSEIAKAQDDNKLIDYCLQLENLSWQGSIHYATDKNLIASEIIPVSTAGDFSLTGLNITDNRLNQSLAKLRSTTFNDVTINGLNDIRIKEIIINHLSALQRSDDNNGATVALAKLSVTDLIYATDNLSIDAINFSELKAHVSINKNGKFEHDKWRLTDDDKSSTKTDKKQPVSNKPFNLSINTLSLATEETILFTDNSTTPVTKAGLQKLFFETSKLYTAKPETNSPFKLSATTTRHSTIDIAGTAKLFANKISFDADGKLKGFDLRAASPAAKKAIGHIIKSGQLDADLTLRAKEGVLDSNIALSLYHFNIKAESKKDAEKLDKDFGMPLNQTLVLLRDKDNSIHLDIPITGDTSNPDFNPMHAIIKATSKAATVTLITFYTPYGLIYAGGNILFDLATAMNFDPVEFSPGLSTLDTAGKKQLNTLATLMTEKPQIRLTLCGMTNNRDTLSLATDLEKQSDKNDLPLSNKQSSAY